MSDRDTELKPCPFCGGEAKLWVSDVTHRAIVYCGKCDAEIKMRHTEQEAIEAWNKRVGDTNKTMENDSCGGTSNNRDVTRPFCAGTGKIIGCPDHYGLKKPPKSSKGCRNCEACWEEAFEKL